MLRLTYGMLGGRCAIYFFRSLRGNSIWLMAPSGFVIPKPPIALNVLYW